MDTKVYEIILPLLRSGIWGEEKFPFTCPAEVDWDEVYKELRAQTVHYLHTNILRRVDEKNSIKYHQNTAVALRSWIRIMQAQQNLYALLQKENIPFVILKGAAVDIYYPEPIYRCMGDIDFIVKPEDFDRTAKCLEENGYELIDANHARHYEYKKDNILLEMHHHFSVLNDTDSEIWQDNLIMNAIDHASCETIYDFTFPMLPPLENGLVLLTHINQHMENGLGLRQIIDWMLYVDREVTDDFWNTSLGPATERIGLKTLAITVTKMCQIYLGLTKELEFMQEADVVLCNELMEYIMEQGNFGRKRGNQGNTAIQTLGINNIFSLWKILQEKGLQNWTATQTYPFLRPFAWIYQIGRYIHLGFKRKKPLKQLKDDYLMGKYQDDFFNRLGVTRYINKKESH